MTTPKGDALHQEMAERLERRPWPTSPMTPGVDVSFEFFPPAGPKGQANLSAAFERLARFAPRFASVTYGAGGSTQLRTLDTVQALREQGGAPIAGHLTCVGATEARVHDVLDHYHEQGVQQLVALRGDPPTDDGDAIDGDFADAAALVAAVRARPDGDRWDISVAGYPEVHPRAASAASDLDNLRRKVDAGADRVLTQFFFDNDAFLRFHDDARRVGVQVPIVPGIMPVTSFERIANFAAKCGTRIPAWLPQLFEGLDDDADVQELVAATIAAEQCRDLAEHGIRSFHFYTMNRAQLTEATCRMLGLTPVAESAESTQVSQAS